MKASWGARTHTGLVRRGNEDSYLVQEPLFAVADGMGGHLAGDVASSTAVDAITTRARDADASNPETLAQMLKAANAAIFERAQKDQSLQGMGTTCTLLMLDEDRAHLAHVGDSRAYRFRDGRLEQLTEDHTLVGRMVRDGRLSAKEAERHPQRSIITRALGVDDDVEVDVTTVALQQGDRVLLCSDGLSSMVSNEAIEDVLRSVDDPQETADRLVDLALESGGEDNVTVLIIAVGETSPRRDPQAHLATGTTPAIPDARPARGEKPPSWGGVTQDASVRSPGTRGGAATAPSSRSASRAGEIERRRPPGGKLVLWLLVLAAVAALLFVGARFALANSWYVGVNKEGYVTIYRGRPEAVGGMDLSEEEDVTSLRLESLPDYLQEDVREGIKVETLEEARGTVENLENRTTAKPKRA